MTTPEKWLLAFAGVLAAGALWFALAATTNAGTTPGEIAASAGVEISDLATRPHICQASQIPRALRRRHPLYRRPLIPRPAATVLMSRGWAGWVTDPPSEAS